MHMHSLAQIPLTSHGALLGMLPFYLRYVILTPVFMFIGYKAGGPAAAWWSLGIVVAIIVSFHVTHGNTGSFARGCEYIIIAGLAGMLAIDRLPSNRARYQAKADARRRRPRK